MLHHTVLFHLDDAATAEAVDAAVAALEALPAEVPTLRTLAVHRDLGLAEGNAALLLEATFEDEAAYRAYATHPAHVAVVTDLVRPVISGRTAIQTTR